MHLLSKVTLIAIIIILLALIVFYAARQPASSAITKQQAESFVISDLMQSNPNASINVINAAPSTLKSGSWSIMVSIIYNSTRACPTVLVKSFDYPAFTLSSVVDSYTTGTIPCAVHGLSNVSSYLISLPQVAIAIATNSSMQASSYASLFGYNKTVAHAHFYSSLASSSTPLGKNLSNVWLVNYTASDSNYSEYVVLGSTGGVVGSFAVQK
ncbi:MAG: hypothetical protein QXR58_00345 [Candidatus Micrarchaeaceae archaeon]